MKFRSFVDNCRQVLNQGSFSLFVSLVLVLAVVILVWVVVLFNWPVVGITSLLVAVMGRIVWAGVRGR